jgi:hypothetical protein
MHELMGALRAAHGQPMFTLYQNGVHYDAKKGLREPNFLAWIFALRKGAAQVPFEKLAGPMDKRPTSLQKK